MKKISLKISVFVSWWENSDMFKNKEKLIGVDGYYFEVSKLDKTVVLHFNLLGIYSSGVIRSINVHQCEKKDMHHAPEWVKNITKHNKLLDC